MAWWLVLLSLLAAALLTVVLWAALVVGKRADEDWERAVQLRRLAETMEEEEGLVPPPM